MRLWPSKLSASMCSPRNPNVCNNPPGTKREHGKDVTAKIAQTWSKHALSKLDHLYLRQYQLTQVAVRRHQTYQAFPVGLPRPNLVFHPRSSLISELLPAILGKLVNLDTCIFEHPKVGCKPGSNALRQRVTAVKNFSMSFPCRPLLIKRNHKC